MPMLRLAVQLCMGRELLPSCDRHVRMHSQVVYMDRELLPSTISKQPATDWVGGEGQEACRGSVEAVRVV